MRSPGCTACSTSAKADPLLQTMATIGPLAIFNNGVLPGGASETRTRDPLLAKQVLFQLSYSPNGVVPTIGYPRQPLTRGVACPNRLVSQLTGLRS